MGGRGRGGRGRGGAGSSMSFNIENLGFTRGEVLPQATLAPSATFPPLNTQPLPLFSDDKHKYLTSVRKEFICYWSSSDHYIHTPIKNKSVERYSDRYHGDARASLVTNRLQPLSFIPAELRVDNGSGNSNKRKMKAKSSKNVAPVKVARIDHEEAQKRLEALEKNESVAEGAENGAEKQNDEDQENVDDDEEPDEDAELDDGTDYANDFFDNGENYLDAEDDALEEGPVF